MYDNSDRSTMVTDFGVLGNVVNGMGSLAQNAMINNAGVVNSAFAQLKASNDDQLAIMKTAFGFVADGNKNQLTGAKDVFTYAAEQNAKLADAFAASKADPNQKMMLSAIAGIAIVGALLAYKQ